MDLKLNVLLGMIDKATRPLRSVTGNAITTAKALRETRQRLKDLGKAQADIKGFRDLKTATRQLQDDLAKARQRAGELGRAIAATTAPTRAQTREFNAARRKADELQRGYQGSTQRLQAMRTALSAAGINTRNLAAHERQLRDQVAATNAQLATQQTRLQKVSEQQRRMGVARQAFERSQATGAHLAIGGAATLATGRHLVGAIHPELEEASRYGTELQRLRALGLGEQANKDAEAFAKGMRAVGNSLTDNLRHVRDAMSVFGDEHHAQMAAPVLAKIKFANEALYGGEDGAANEERFVNMLKVIELRGGTTSQAKFNQEANFVQKVLTATGGRVGPDQWREFIQRGGVAAKQLSDESFYYGMEPLVQEMGGAQTGTGLMSLYNNLYQGRSTLRAAKEMMRLGLLDKDKVEYNTIGNIKQIRPGALKGGDVFKANPMAWLETVLLPSLEAKGITDPGAIKDTIASIAGNRTAANLLSTMYMQRAQIHKNMKLSAGADGIDAAMEKAKGTARGQEIDLEAKRADLYRELGNQLLPLYVAGLQKLIGVTRALTGWTQRHPALARGIMVVAASMGVLAIGAGGLMLALGGLIGQFAVLRYAMRLGGIKLGLGAAADGAGGGFLARLFPAIANGARAAAAAVAGVSLPVVALLAAIAVGALLVRKYWGPIRAWFQGVGQGIAQAIGPVLDGIGQALAPLKPAWDAIGGAIATVWGWLARLVAPFQATREQLDGARQNGVAFGQVLGVILDGVVRAVTFGVRMFIGLGEAIGTAAGMVAERWGPVRAWFADLWGGIKAAARGALDWIDAKLQAVRGFIDRLAAAWARLHGRTAPAMGSAPVEWITGADGDRERAQRIAQAIARTPLDGAGGDATGGRVVVNTPPIATKAAAPQVHVAGDTVQVHVDARGMQPHEAAAAVRKAMDDHARDKQARARSAYTDED